MFSLSIINICLRSFTLVSKFILLMFMAKYLSPHDLGIYGLITATIGISLYFVGMDFYVYNTREILAKEQEIWPCLIRDQFVFHGLVYTVILPLLMLVFISGQLSWEYVVWFYLLLVLEHLSQEFYRIFISLSRPIVANIVLFFRSGAWIYAVVVFMYFKDDANNLTTVWLGWIIGIMVSLIFSFYFLRNLPWNIALNSPIDWSWIKKGAFGAVPFLGATLAMKGVETVDRYFIRYYHREAMVGIYTFYSSIANVVQTFIFTGVTMILFPKIVSAYQQGRIEDYRVYMRKMGFGAIGGALVVAGIIATTIDPVLRLVGKVIYKEHILTFWVLLVSVIVMAMESIPHYALYVRRWDRAIIASSLIAFGVSVLANLTLVPLYGPLGAAFATLFSMLTLISCKSAILIYCRNK